MTCYQLVPLRRNGVHVADTRNDDSGERSVVGVDEQDALGEHGGGYVERTML